MTFLHKKLKSQAGASMLLALLFLFFALSIGAVVLTAASANAGRSTRLRQEQQDYFAVQSAARLLRDELQPLAFRGSYTKTIVETTTFTDHDDGTSTRDTSQSGPYYRLQTAEAAGSALAALLADDYKAQYASRMPGGIGYSPEAHTLTIQPELEGLSPVTATVTLQKNYTLEIVLSLADDGSNRMVLTLQGKELSSSYEETFDESSENSSTTEYVTTYASDISFEPGVIQKEAAA